MVVQMLDIEKTCASKKTYDYFNKVIIYLTKMVMHDYSLLTSESKNHLSTGCLYVAFKIMEQIQSSFSTKELVLLLPFILLVSPDDRNHSPERRQTI